MNIVFALYFLLQIPVKGFLYRARGMHHDALTTQEARILFWALPWGLDAAIIASHLVDNPLTIMTVAIMSVVFGWVATLIRHSAWQSPSWHNYVCMGIVTILMLETMLIPLEFMENKLFVFPYFGLLGIVASWLGYSKYVANKTLTLFGITWCRPVAVGGSEFEELFIGILAFGVPICLMGLWVIFFM